MTKFLYLGYSLTEVVEAVTNRAAEWNGWASRSLSERDIMVAMTDSAGDVQR